MRNKKIGGAAVLILAFLGYASTLPAVFLVNAAGASVSFSPASGTYAVGASITVKVMVDSGGGIGVNAADGTITFDPAIATVQSVSKDGSIFNLWTSDPAYSNTDGTVTYSGGTTSGYTGSAGQIIAITFKAVSAGMLDLKFKSATALAADGQGTSVLQNTGTGSLTIGGSVPAAASPKATPPPPPPAAAKAPASQEPPFTVDVAIQSPTHPDPEKWYASANPQFTWTLPAEVAGVSTLLDQKPASVPGKSTEGAIASKQYNAIKDGEWYFHARFEDSFGNWSAPVHRKVLIDTTPPDPFALGVILPATPDAHVALAFHSTDTISGIDHYEVAFNGGDAISVSPNDVANGTYAAPPLLPGKYAVTVKALDMAGNHADSAADFEVQGIAMPKISDYTDPVVADTPIVIEGVADPRSTVTIAILDASEKTVTQGTAGADESGRFTYALRSGIGSGTYHVTLDMTTLQGAESSSTDRTVITVVMPPFMERFGWIITVLLVLVILGLVAYLYHRKKLLNVRLKRVESELGESFAKTRVVFEALRDEVDEKVSHMEGGAAQAQGEEKLEPDQVMDILRSALGVSESEIVKELEDTQKALKE